MEFLLDWTTARRAGRGTRLLNLLARSEPWQARPMQDPGSASAAQSPSGRRLRITIVQGPFLPVPPLLGGAVERTMDSLGRAWAAAGHRVVHVSRRYPGLPDREEREGVTHIRVASRDAPAGRLRFRWHELRYCLRVLRVLPEADILVSNAVLFPLLARRPSRGKLVVRLERPPKGQLRFYRHAAAFHTVSEDMRRRILAEAPWAADRVAVVGSPLSGAMTPMRAADLTNPREPLVLFAGRLHPEKGLELLIQAFARLAERHPGWRLEIIGPHAIAAGGGGEAYLARLRDLAKALGNRVAFTGPVYDHGELARRLRAAEIFVYPSIAEKGEALGLAPLEAMGQGCVPVVSSLPCFADFIRHGENGLVFDQRADDAVEQLAAMLETGIKTGELRRTLQRAAIFQAGHYGLPLVSARHVSSFTEL
jgi:glycosyltransferase involved in cell wall biosynthesis